MNLELLPNELLVEIFEFLDGVHLFKAFYNLNIRFNNLLLSRRKNLSINFERISKEDFESTCQHLCSIPDRIISIRIHDEFETPNLPEFFLRHGFQMNYFTQLQSLTLYSIHSVSMLMKITRECENFPNLIHLNIIGRDIGEHSRHLPVFLNNIWKLPKLTHCNLSSIRGMKNYQIEISSISLPIQHLSIVDCDLYTFFQILRSTPNLQHFHTTIHQTYEYVSQGTLISSLTSLHISFSGADTSLINLFRGVPKLRCLTLEIPRILWNGHVWEEVLCTYLSKLRIFRFQMKGYIFHKYNTTDELLQSFRTPFWLVKHQWFVGCYWNPTNINRIGLVCTVPYTFNTLQINNDWYFRSTYPDNDSYLFCNRVQQLMYSGKQNISRKIPFWCPNIRQLHIDCPYDFNWFVQLLSCNQLRFLSLVIKHDFDYDLLQLALNRLLHLYSLAIDIQTPLSDRFFQLISSSIRRLDLPLFNHMFHPTVSDCHKFISSSLGQQCEVLSIEIDNRFSLLDLIQRLPNLRALRFQYRGDKQTNRESNTQLIQWLEKSLPFICSFNQPRKLSDPIEIWINRQTKNIALSSNISNRRFSSLNLLKRMFSKSSTSK